MPAFLALASAVCYGLVDFAGGLLPRAGPAPARGSDPPLFQRA